MYKIALVLIIAVLLFAGISGCGGSGSESEVEVPDYVDTLVEELLEAIKFGDYTAYLEHFEAGAEWVMPEDYFSQEVAFIQKRIGHYISMSKELSEVNVGEKYTEVIYKTRFSSEPDDVVVMVTYYISDNRVYAEGIWFNSPRLRGE